MNNETKGASFKLSNVVSLKQAELMKTNEIPIMPLRDSGSPQPINLPKVSDNLLSQDTVNEKHNYTVLPKIGGKNLSLPSISGGNTNNSTSSVNSSMSTESMSDSPSNTEPAQSTNGKEENNNKKLDSTGNVTTMIGDGVKINGYINTNGKGDIMTGSGRSSSSQQRTCRKNSPHSGSICKNCATVNTPLWRRDNEGNTLCNACGLFLKLHGTPRPINLNTTVIKSRNRKSNHNSQSQKNMGVSRTGPHLNNISHLGSYSNHYQKLNSDVLKRTHGFKDIDLSILSDPHRIKKIRCNIHKDRNLPMGQDGSDILKAAKCMKPEIRPKVAPDRSDIRRYSFPSASEQTQNKFSSLVNIPDQLQTSFNDVFSNSKFAEGGYEAKNLDGSHYTEPDNDPTRQNISDSNLDLSELLVSEEETIKLKTRINELELVTDLYKSYIFRLNEKCQHLESVLHSILETQQ
ncbi:Dal80p KNAG_0C01440 [Huiozyma naganishii CBS 8797]|uniref:GATA-type domain-containing protein n=1 Tax=Huiozyma naganishii (strain ATCC MYA-139 / BCRC 22969 / CBS 8797 / KCTC 17520 / NBRC 10181 / NCYC 3082 / Yp74L-3) TaxID=1071383 RepID=J7RW85_HUIN7|nr:hypothetical protein KNAG_0C01440 [Kazachstania naganishii CBS 8797]CCK69257.1 hypothetical protein KNAG_0C01440 [Kazachstania naganishii CBS 8797]